MEFLHDDIYIEQVLNGNTKAFAFLVDKYKVLVYTVAFRILRNHEDTEEIVQDAFVKAYHALDSFEKKSKFSTWLHRIVYNSAISKTRKKKLETNPLDDFLIENYSIDNTFENLDELTHEEQKTLLDVLISKLDPEESAIISMYYISDHSTDEIAEITGLSQSNVKVKLHRIRAKLQVYLKQYLKKNISKIQT
ncbi:MAG TPA: RNA polymerase sigma factor [Bacteroidales bacterium]|nr:RNA polymerase sigma factor [Bacteroidales bacterium]